MSLFFQLFAGVPMDEMDTFPLVPLGCWLFPIGIYLLIISFRLGMDKQIWVDTEVVETLFPEKLVKWDICSG